GWNQEISSAADGAAHGQVGSWVTEWLGFPSYRATTLPNYSSGGAPPLIFATSSCFTFSTLNLFADAIILSITSSKSNSVDFEKRIGLMRATTKGFRYGLVSPFALSDATTLPTASSSFSTFDARRSRSFS